jgi:hypothetical protein
MCVRKQHSIWRFEWKEILFPSGRAGRKDEVKVSIQRRAWCIPGTEVEHG